MIHRLTHLRARIRRRPVSVTRTHPQATVKQKIYRLPPVERRIRSLAPDGTAHRSGALVLLFGPHPVSVMSHPPGPLRPRPPGQESVPNAEYLHLPAGMMSHSPEPGLVPSQAGCHVSQVVPTSSKRKGPPVWMKSDPLVL